MTATVVLVLRIGLVVVLYYFLWRVLQTLWKDLGQQGLILSTQKKPGIRIDTKMESGEEGKQHFRQTEIVIGRGAHCNISIKDDALSATHARMSFLHAQWWLEDLGSTNGTFLNKDQITTPTVVISDDQFKCGNTTFTLRIDNSDTHFPKQQITESGGGE
jgi:pSer/pThr/pTyr-binding forkhead associated (FHA) protein